MKRLLCIVSAMNTGGAETFLMKIYRSLDREKYQMDFLVNSSTNYYEKEILELGGKIYTIPAKSESILGWYKGTKRVVRDNGYRYVIRVCEHSLAALDLLVAKQGGADHLIMRSSNAASGNKKSYFLHRLFQFLAISVPTVKLAPSTEAAEYTFGKGCVDRGEAKLIHNAVDTDIYHFDAAARKKIRDELDLNGKLVVGHVGRFSQQKNHNFLIEIFKELLQKKPDARLLLVGQGELQGNIQEKVRMLGIADKVIFTGVRSDVPALMSAMDVFVFPSFYEGMPNTVIEAQACGVPCVISDSITREVNVTDLVLSFSLRQSPEHWAEKLQNFGNHNTNRNRYSDEMKKNGYDIDDCVEHFVDLVFAP